MSELAFIGKGWAFPPAFITTEAGPEMVDGEEDIKQSLHIILSTTLGERHMHATFGSRLADFVFEELTADVLSELREDVTNAIDQWESRIDLDGVQLDNSELINGLLKINIQYQIRETNARDNLVYPFYLLN